MGFLGIGKVGYMVRKKRKVKKGSLIFGYLILAVVCIFIFTLNLEYKVNVDESSPMGAREEKLETENNRNQIEVSEKVGEEDRKSEKTENIRNIFADEHRRMFGML